MRKYLKRLRNLRGIHFDFEDCNKISLDGVEQITQTFKTLTALQRIVVKICGYEYDIEIKQSENRVTLKQLIRRNFWRDEPEIEFNGLRELLTTFQKANFTAEYSYLTMDSNLKHLSLDLKSLKALPDILVNFS